MRKPHGDAEQACFTTAVMVSGFSCIRVIFIQIGCLCKVDHAYHVCMVDIILLSRLSVLQRISVPGGFK